MSGSSCSSSDFGLGALGCGVGLDQPRVAADLPQSQQRGEEVKLLLRQFFLSFDPQEQLLRAFQLSPIERLLLAFDFAKQIFLDPIGQVLGNLRFCPAQQKWAHARGQPPPRQRIALWHHRAGRTERDFQARPAW